MTTTPPPDPAEPANEPYRTAPSAELSRLGCGAPSAAASSQTPPSARTTDNTQTRTAASALTFTEATAIDTISRYYVAGTIDATTCEAFGAHLDDIVTARRPFLLDLTAVPFVSVGGLTLLEALAHTTAQREIRWALAAEYSLHRFLTLLNMDTHVPSFDNADTALTHITNTLATVNQPPGPCPREQ
ncbi:STAS domain-containing protein [Rhodococcus erythropolis]|uniref:STAS domain-containing protein n=1 Tax=Rhodococcus erythropolis TaxID=1833 RepID=UPI002226F66A|nr:STAS domain-containing protein [Rhodococcus erythropolis]MCW2295531.1 anti-anti-sigma regulatory factor [Rhodococcus erythropolis]